MNRTYGVLLRVYTPKVEEVAARVERAVAHVRHIRSVQEEFPALKSIALVVPQDHDCGETGYALFRHTDIAGTFVWGLPGHHSCGALNAGVAGLERIVSHVLIISGKAISYLTPAVMHAIDEAFQNGARVVGLAVDELREIVLAGRVQNTFAAWDIRSLQDVGGFDSKTGVEEFAPSVRMLLAYGQCIAPLDVQAGRLDIAESETAKARHADVMATKIERQLAECERMEFSFDEIKAGILPGYPRPV